MINESQYDFRTNRSTSMDIESVEEITSILGENKYAAGIFFDLKKASDTLDWKSTA